MDDIDYGPNSPGLEDPPDWGGPEKESCRQVWSEEAPPSPRPEEHGECQGASSGTAMEKALSEEELLQAIRKSGTHEEKARSAEELLEVIKRKGEEQKKEAENCIKNVKDFRAKQEIHKL